MSNYSKEALPTVYHSPLPKKPYPQFTNLHCQRSLTHSLPVFIDGVEVEFYWDVLSWVVDSENDNGYGVFVFQVGDGGVVWPEMVGPEKKLMKKRIAVMEEGARRLHQLGRVGAVTVVSLCYSTLGGETEL
ncbi:hypothetical protein LR48_Vigan148s000600 [Vigna angularis]|uniref:Uncharacterized protein n=1 Tax=Phaseolus angularis TaxID=3914 RepID=A0A0L9T4Y6_PHAAN|nr:hypothetical protein LR48_Vigan148s000600 [Vigna angularis]